jgi:hypothetical protein
LADFFGAHSPAASFIADPDVEVRGSSGEAPARLRTSAATTVAEGKSMGAVPTEIAD